MKSLSHLFFWCFADMLLVCFYHYSLPPPFLPFFCKKSGRQTTVSQICKFLGVSPHFFKQERNCLVSFRRRFRVARFVNKSNFLQAASCVRWCHESIDHWREWPVAFCPRLGAVWHLGLVQLSGGEVQGRRVFSRLSPTLISIFLRSHILTASKVVLSFKCFLSDEGFKSSARTLWEMRRRTLSGVLTEIVEEN